MATSDPFDELHRLIERGDKARTDALDAVEVSRRILEQNESIREQSLAVLQRWRESNAAAQDFLWTQPPQS